LDYRVERERGGEREREREREREIKLAANERTEAWSSKKKLFKPTFVRSLALNNQICNQTSSPFKNYFYLNY